MSEGGRSSISRNGEPLPGGLLSTLDEAILVGSEKRSNRPLRRPSGADQIFMTNVGMPSAKDPVSGGGVLAHQAAL